MNEKIRTLIVDDEPLARRNLRLLLEKDPQIEIVDECRNGREAVKAINALSPDLIFLDIQMPEMDGFDVLERVGPDHIQGIIFVTAFDQYALKAFDVHALESTRSISLKRMGIMRSCMSGERRICCGKRCTTSSRG
jgi:two-component system LytT family response regulator